MENIVLIHLSQVIKVQTMENIVLIQRMIVPPHPIVPYIYGHSK